MLKNKKNEDYFKFQVVTTKNTIENKEYFNMEILEWINIIAPKINNLFNKNELNENCNEYKVENSQKINQMKDTADNKKNNTNNVKYKINSKEIVDMPLLTTLYQTEIGFHDLQKAIGTNRVSELRKLMKVQAECERIGKLTKKFIITHFGQTGSDLYATRFKDEIVGIRRQKEIKGRCGEIYAAALNKMVGLCRRQEVKRTSTYIEMPYTAVVPGDRFREMYYWDSYWVMLGLVNAGMIESCCQMLENFVALVETYGMVPNGTREYYKNRTQPPVLAKMVYLVYKQTGDSELIRRGLKAVLKEHSWFMANRAVHVLLKKISAEAENEEEKIIEDKRTGINDYGDKMVLNIYNVSTNSPRPEMYANDKKVEEDCTEKSSSTIYSNIKTAAESGWDFSSRWTLNNTNMSEIEIRNMIPVDLNALLYESEKIMAELFNQFGDKASSEKYSRLRDKRAHAINHVLWNEKQGVWNDYNFVRHEFNNRRFYFSNITPMLFGIKPPREFSWYKILKRYAVPLFGYPGGSPASSEKVNVKSSSKLMDRHNDSCLENNGKDGCKYTHPVEQWDFPNVWAPLQSLLVSFLLEQNEHKLAYHAARCFFNSIETGYCKDNCFFEKYDCRYIGKTGFGGEYEPQQGFGWTNGVVLYFIWIFKEKLNEPFEHLSSFKSIKRYLYDKQ